MTTQPRLFDILDELPEGVKIELADGTTYTVYPSGNLVDDVNFTAASAEVLRATSYRVLIYPCEKGYGYHLEREEMVYFDAETADDMDIVSDFTIPERELAKHWLASVRMLTLLANRPGATFCGNFTVTINPHLQFQSRELNPEAPTVPGMIYFDTLANADKAAEWMNNHHPLKLPD